MFCGRFHRYSNSKNVHTWSSSFILYFLSDRFLIFNNLIFNIINVRRIMEDVEYFEVKYAQKHIFSYIALIFSWGSMPPATPSCLAASVKIQVWLRPWNYFKYRNMVRSKIGIPNINGILRERDV